MLFTSLIFGLAVASYVKLFDSFFERLSFAIPFGIASFSFVEAFLYALTGRVTSLTVYLAIIALLAASVLLYFLKDNKSRKAFFGKKILPDLPVPLQVAAIAIIIAISIIFLFSLSESNGTVICIDAGCGDISYHIGIGNSLMNYAFPPRYTFTLATTNVYPFISDFFPALLRWGGMSLVPSIMVPDLLLIFSMVSLAAVLAYRLLKDSFASICALLIFWFGGNGISQFIEYPFRTQVATFFQPAHLLYVNGPTEGVFGFFNTLFFTSSEFITYWVPILNTMLIAQRDFLLGMPFGLLIILLIIGFIPEKNKKIVKTDSKLLFIIGVLVGMLPLIHPPTFVVVSIFGGFVILYSTIKSRKIEKKWLIAIIMMLFLAVPQFVFMNSQNRSEGFFGISSAYLVRAESVPLSALYSAAYLLFFWMDVVGIAFITGIIGFAIADRRLKLISVTFLLLIVLITFFNFLPNPADSNKVFMYAFLFLSILTGYVASALWHRGRLQKVLAIVIVGMITFNYVFIVYMHNVNFPQILYSSAEMNATRFIMNNTAPDAVFAVSNYMHFYQPVSSVAARTTLISVGGYVGGIYTYPVGVVIDANNEIFEHGNCTTIKTFDVSYIYLLSKGQGEDSVFMNSNFSRIYNATDAQQNQRIEIFKTRC
jgi:hypothetical protein